MVETGNEDGAQRLRRAADDGLRLALLGRAVALAIAALWPAIFLPAGLYVATILLASAGIGVLYRRIVGTGLDLPAYRFAIFTVDILCIGAVFAFVPLSSSEAVPQIMAFRAYGIYYFLPVLGVAALALSPALLLWCGAATTVTWWAAFAWVTAPMPRRLSWGDLSSGQSYVSLIMDVDFVGGGNRVEETFAFLVLTVLVAFAVHRARRVVVLWADSEAARDRISSLFGRFAPPEVVDRLTADGGALGPSRRIATVMFIDIAGFTSLSEARDPQTIVALLNTYFETAGTIAANHGGVIVNFQGDGLLLAFNAPAEVPDHAAAALACAKELLVAIDAGDFNGERIAIRIGIHTGEVAAGLVGSSDRQTYIVYGDTVNVAARLEALNKQYGTRLLVSRTTVDAAGTDAGLDDLGEADIRGHNTPVSVLGLR